MRRFLVCCSIASLVGSVVLSLAPAQAHPNTCRIVGNQAGRMFVNAPLGNRLESFSSDSYFRVECSGAATGRLRLSIGAGGKLYNNASVSFRLIGADGVFAATTSEYGNAPVIVAYTNAYGIASGKVRYQMRVVAPDGYLLPAAPDYAVNVHAELIQ